MKSTAIAIVVAGALIGGAVLFSGINSTGAGPAEASADNVSIVDGTQIVEVSVSAGYHPKKSLAKAGIPTVLRFSTNSTYDCSASVRIPSMGLSKFLPATGKTDLSLGTPQAGVLRGMCGMGMYTFEVDFGS
jgi:plastocyanin domain-containing protein